VFISARRADDQALLQFFTDEPVSFVDSTRFGRGLASGTYRREWTWLAFVDDEPVARGVWWGPSGSVHPIELHCLVVHPSLPHPEVWGAALIRTAHRAFAEAGAILAPDFVVDLAGERHADPAVELAVDWRRLAATDAGLPVETDDGRRVTFSARPLPAGRLAPVAATGR
jgi:hypothetical protein